MKVIQVSKDIVLFQFEKTSNSLVGTNIVAILNDNEYVLVDTGYEEHLAQVLVHLGVKKCKYVIQTHYHPDHIFGLHLLENIVKIGSKYAVNTINEFGFEEDKKIFPDIIVNETKCLVFGKHTFKMHLNIGHSICGMLIDLNEEILFVGDDILLTNEGEAIFPYLTLGNIDKCIAAQRNVLKHGIGRIIIPGHGKPINNDSILKTDIQNRISYFNFLKKEKDIEEFEKKTKIHFLGKKSWHENNVAKVSIEDIENRTNQK